LRWGPPDGRKIGAVTRYPCDANASDTFLQLPKNLGRMLEGDYAPTVTLAHYPKHARRWLSDLFVGQQYAPVFGRFHSFSGFFKATKYTGQTNPLDEAVYAKSRQLVEAVKAKRTNPVSAWADYHQMTQRCGHITTLAMLIASVVGKKSDVPAKAFAEARSFLESFETAKRQHDRQLYGNVAAEQSPVNLRGFAKEADNVIARLSCYLGAALTVQPADTVIERNSATASGVMPNEWGYLLLNPSPHSRNMLIDISELPALPTVHKDTESQQSSPVLLARDDGSLKEALVEVPPFGYAWVGCEPAVVDAAGEATPGDQVGQRTEASRKTIASKVRGLFAGKKETGPPPMVYELTDEGYCLRNEFFELRVDKASGAVASLFYHNKRGNRLAQQLAFRFPDDLRKQDTRPAKDGNAGYSIMAADTFEIAANGPLSASLKTTGRLMHFDGSVVATFEQTITVARNSKIVRFDIAITPETMPGNSPWDSYYAARFAWGNADFEPTIGISSGHHACLTKYVEAPYFIDLRCCDGVFRNETQSLTVFTHGLPYHRRTSDTRLDTILIAANEQRHSFRIDVGIDVSCTMAVAQELMVPHEPLVVRSPKPKIPTAWLFSCDAKNVVMLKCEPLFDEIWKPSAKPVDVVPVNDASPNEGSTYNPMSAPGYGYGGIYSSDDIPPDNQPWTEPEKEPRNNIDEGWRFPKLADSLQDDGRPLTGMRLWLLETEGQRTEWTFRSFRSVQAVRIVDFELNEEKTPAVTGDRVTISFAPHEFLPVEIRF